MKPLESLRSAPASLPSTPQKIDFNQKRFIGKCNWLANAAEYGLVLAVTLRNDPTSTLYAMKVLMKDKLPPINTSVV